MTSVGEPTIGQVLLVHEDNVASAKNALAAIIKAIDGGIVLIVAADRRQEERFFRCECRILADSGRDQEGSFAADGIPATEGGRNVQSETTRIANPGIEVEEIGEDRLDLVADAIVVSNKAVPVNAVTTTKPSLRYSSYNAVSDLTMSPAASGTLVMRAPSTSNPRQ